MRKPGGLRKCRTMENEENQEQVFRRFPPSLEIAAAIPTFPPRLRLPSFSQNQIKKEFSAPGPPHLSSGSFFDENMLGLNRYQSNENAE